MVTQKDIFITAQSLITSHGDKASKYALEQMRIFTDKEDYVGADVWSSIYNAIGFLTNAEPEGNIQ